MAARTELDDLESRDLPDTYRSNHELFTNIFGNSALGLGAESGTPSWNKLDLIKFGRR